MKKTKKPTKAEWPTECPHKHFFGCKTPKDCPTCYYNPDIKQKPWFYSDSKHAQECLALLEDIRLGRGLRPGGSRFPWKYGRKNKDEEE